MADAADFSPSDSESGILHRAQSGDERAFESLMRAHYESTFRMACSILRDEHEARDVCQEVWVTVWRRLGGFRGEAKFSTWLHPIVVRRAIDRLRTRQRWYRRFLPLGGGEEESASAVAEPAAPESPPEEAERNERRRVFERAVTNLSPKLRVVLALREIEELSYEDMASTLHLRVGTVMSRLFNARRQLARQLEKLP